MASFSFNHCWYRFSSSVRTGTGAAADEVESGGRETFAYSEVDGRELRRVVTAGATGTGRRRRQLRQIALLVLSELVEAAGSSGQFKLKLDSEYYCPCCWRIYLSLVCFGSGAFFAFPLVDLPGRPRSSSRIVTAMLLYTSIIIFAFI